MKKFLCIVSLLAIFASCNNNEFNHDASGTFEATETIISSEIPGKIQSFKLMEGDFLKKGQYLGNIDSLQLYYQKLIAQTSVKGVKVRRPDISAQIAATLEQLKKAEFEKKRIQRLLEDNAATQKQLDDINSHIAVIQKSLDAQKNTLAINVNALDEESKVYNVQAAQIEDQLRRCKIINPVEGTVLNKYAEENEVVSQGTPLYKIADIRNMILRVYVVAPQLEKLKIGQSATVFINAEDGKQKTYKGKISWISDKAEFTPKTIQTQEERQNLVYAVKINVPNVDKMIKIGMYGDADFNW
ncbi:MAG: HlyD family efflux transporter periplasmic adaptor subunit [Flavobacteriaceae bacterium]|jgi:HlyD family secretion protein|nr:HlyD family efflux transporter periplasmic adaptor subunit [Flavobacteriaceae bacterium]